MKCFPGRIRQVQLLCYPLALLLLCTGQRTAAALDTNRPDVRRFIARVAKQDSFSKRRLRELLAAAQTQPAIIEAMDRRAEHVKLWFEYRAIFVNEKRIQEGADFWIAHRGELARASASSGVAPEYIVAILGVETSYGRSTGRYRVLDALATLAFDYPSRAKFFQDELEAFLLLTREASIDPLAATGSYAGAMGAPQFMPSNYRRYAVDAAGDGHIDLWTNWLDVFASVGNYFREHGWIPGEPVLSEASNGPDADVATTLDGRSLSMVETVGSLQGKGIHFETMQPATAPAVLIAADDADRVHWRIGYHNFYVITRYNHSMLYAMAVHDLAQMIRGRVAVMDAIPAPVVAPAPDLVPFPLPGATAAMGAPP
ncbi:MAG: lytic murein transglycosylase B [Steroidobacterales bacterium]